MAVAEKKGPKTYYHLTKAGELYQRLAKFALINAVENKYSLSKVFGYMQLDKPLNRFRVLSALSREKDTRIVDLQNYLGISPGSIRRNLRALEDMGLVRYTSVSNEQPGTYKYKWKSTGMSESAEKMPDLPDRAKEVAKMLLLGNSDSHEIARLLKDKTKNIVRILSRLEDEGLAKRAGKFLPHEKQSEINITRYGKKFIKNFLKPFYWAVLGDYREIDRCLETVQDIYSYIQKGYDLYEGTVLFETEKY